MVQHLGGVCPRLRPLPSHCVPQTLQDVSVELFIDCPATWNKLVSYRIFIQVMEELQIFFILGL